MIMKRTLQNRKGLSQRRLRRSQIADRLAAGDCRAGCPGVDLAVTADRGRAHPLARSFGPAPPLPPARPSPRAPSACAVFWTRAAPSPCAAFAPPPSRAARAGSRSAFESTVATAGRSRVREVGVRSNSSNLRRVGVDRRAGADRRGRRPGDCWGLDLVLSVGVRIRGFVGCAGDVGAVS
jgi:hypothetical protein